jgi:hypothetical protein
MISASPVQSSIYVIIITNEYKFIQKILFRVTYFPWKIKSTNSTICVAARYPDGIYFYNSNDLHLIRNYNPLNDRISQINSLFYEFNHITQTVSCYDDNANLKEQITLKGLNKFLTDIWDLSIIMVPL